MSFKNYVDKMRGVGGQKMPILVHVQGTNVHVEVGRWSEKGKLSTGEPQNSVNRLKFYKDNPEIKCDFRIV